MALHVVGSLLFFAAGGVALYRARWWSRQDFSIHVSYGSHSHGVETKAQACPEKGWCWFLAGAGLLSIALGLWQLAAIIVS